MDFLNNSFSKISILSPSSKGARGQNNQDNSFSSALQAQPDTSKPISKATIQRGGSGNHFIGKEQRNKQSHDRRYNPPKSSQDKSSDWRRQPHNGDDRKENWRPGSGGSNTSGYSDSKRDITTLTLMHPHNGNASDKNWRSRSGGSNQGFHHSKQNATTIKLVCGLKSANHANELLDACINKSSRLQNELSRIGYHGKIDNDKLLVLNNEGGFSIIMKLGHELSFFQEAKINAIFDKRDSVGFVEWLGGSTGWRFEVSDKAEGTTSWKRRFVIQLNTLQSVFTLFAPDEHKFLFVKEKKRMVWRKHNELTDIVSDIRMWIEILEPSILTSQLLRNSNMGPDSVVHWAHHHPVSVTHAAPSYCIDHCKYLILTSFNLTALSATKNNSYPLTIVSTATMLELVTVSCRCHYSLCCF